MLRAAPTLVAFANLPELGPGGFLFLSVVLVASVILAISLGILARQRFQHELRQIVQTLEELRTGRARGRPEVAAGSALVLVSDAVHRLGQDLQGRWTEAEQAAERWRALSDSDKSTAIVTTDTDGDVRSFSHGAVELFGWQEDEVLAQPASVLFDEGAYKDLLPKLGRRSLRREGIVTRSLLARRDGTRFEAEVTVRLLQGSSSQPVGFMLVLRDVTEQVRVERELREAERRYRGLVEGLSDGVIIVKQGAVVYANTAAERLCARAGQTLVGRALRELVATSDVLVVEEALSAVERGTEASREIECSLCDGPAVPGVDARITATRIEFGGGPAVLLLVHDEGLGRRLLCELERNESRLEAVLDATSDGVLVLAGPRGGETAQMVNRAFAEMAGTSPAELLGAATDRLVDLLGDPARDMAAIAEALGGERRGSSSPPADGARELRVSVAELSGRAGESLGRVVVCRDLRDQRRSERELQAQAEQLQLSKVELEQSYRRLSEANQKLVTHTEELERLNQELHKLDELKSALVGNVSHELQTPLVSIRGYTETILRERLGPITPEQRKGLEISLKNIDRLISMIDNLLACGRADPRSHELEIVEFELAPLVREAQEVLGQRIARKRIEVSVAIDPDFARVRADRDQVLQVFLNLMSNAVKFTPEGGRVWISAGRGSAGNVEVRVKDDGVGIPASDLGRIFDRHYRVKRDDHRPEGSGIGLAIVRDILRLHGSTIEVRSEEGQGTELIFTLPHAARVGTAAPPLVDPAPAAEEADPGPQPRLRIIRRDMAEGSA